MALVQLKTELRELEEDEEGNHEERKKELRVEIARLAKQEAVALGAAMGKKKSSSDLNDSGRILGDSSGRVQLSPRPGGVVSSGSPRRVESPRRTAATGSDSPREGGPTSPRALAGSPTRAGRGGSFVSGESPRTEAASMGKRVLDRHVATLNKLFASPGQASAKRQELEAFSEAVALHDKDGAFKEMLNQFFNRLAEEKNAAK